MELLYVWIENHKNIKKQGFNFGSKKRFKYDDNTDVLSITDRSSEVITNFFGSEILNVTAIVGENGAGKSNLLEFLVFRLSSFGNGIEIPYPAECKEILIIGNYIFKTEDINFSNSQDLQDEGYKIHSYKETLTECFDAFSESFLNIGNTYIFYSPNLDDRLIGWRLPNLFDISTNNLIESDLHSIHTNVSGNGSDHINADSYGSFLNMEVKRHIAFLSSGFSDVPFSFPNSLNINIESKEKNRFLNKGNDWVEANDIVDQMKYINEFSWGLQFEDATVDEKFKYILSCSFLTSLMVEYSSEFQGIEDEVLRRWIYLEDFKDDFNTPELNDKVKQVKEYFTILNGLIDAEKIGFRNPDPELYRDRSTWELFNGIQITVDDDTIERIKNLHVAYMNIVAYTPFINYYWSGLSSGERNMLNLYSRFNSFEEDDDTRLLSNIIIFIDEGETGFHPNWQKEYLNSLIKFLPKLFNKDPQLKRTIQIILTSHSPFVISDLPKQNLVLLKKNENNECEVIEELDQVKATFGANIHTLLSDGFFMNGLVGIFAQDKIDEVIAYLNNKANLDGKEVQLTIDMVGDPIIKNYLKNRFTVLEQKNKFEALQNRITALESENQALRNGTNS